MDQGQPVGRIDVISDAICPWCYIGKRHLEGALKILEKDKLTFNVFWNQFQLNPDMPVERVEPFLGDADLALCMTVFPGFGGQAYIPESTDRIRKLRGLIARHNPACDLEVDGGINVQTAPVAAAAGANVFVAGNAVFAAKEGPAAAVKELHRLTSSATA